MIKLIKKAAAYYMHALNKVYGPLFKLGISPRQ